jgi:lysozyme family protein
MTSIREIIDEIIRVEGGFVDHPNDPGGATKYGITQKVARAAGYKGDMRDLPVTTAYDIYYKDYVVNPGYHRLAEIDPAVAAEVVDTGVNMGPAVAGKFLQRALNSLSGSGLVVDGAVGTRTVNALADFLRLRGPGGTKVLLKMLNSLQCVRYIELTESNARNRSFIYGWVANRVTI